MLNWKLRFQNKATLTTLVLAIIALIYQVLGVIGVAPPISQDSVVEIAGMVINILVLLGIVVDPTTHGISDSERAMTYSKPSDAPFIAEGENGETEI